MNPEIKQLWLEALRSGEYTQGEGALCRTTFSTGEVDVQEFCCLGVLSELAHRAGVVSKVQSEDPDRAWKYGEEGNDAYLPEEVQKWAGVETRDPVVYWGDDMLDLSSLNDNEGQTFAQIADAIEAAL